MANLKVDEQPYSSKSEIFEKPIIRGQALNHISKAMSNMQIVVELVYTQEQADLATQIGNLMVRLAREF